MRKRSLIFKAIVSHAVPLENGQRIYSYFGDSNEDHPSITKLQEKEVVKWLFSNNASFILGDLFPDNTKVSYFIEVKEPVLTKEDQKIIGDIDLLAFPINYPNKSVAIEFKCVKVITEDDGFSRVNKLQRVRRKGISQANKLKKLGFERVYLGVIILEDSRHVGTLNTILRRNTTDEDAEAIYYVSFEKSLNENVGVFYITITQPTGEKFYLRNNLGICVDKIATRTSQCNNITSRIERLV